MSELENTLVDLDSSKSQATISGAGAGARFFDALLKHRKARQDNALLIVKFTTVDEYMWMLRMATQEAQRATETPMIYLAAAVSDFYIPPEEMAVHKIQSREQAGLTLKLANTPKMLAPLVKEWCPRAFLVSFKLETDEDLVIKKAQQAIATYGVHRVVANLLHTRKEHVIIVSDGGAQHIRRPDGVAEIEEIFVAELVDAHKKGV